ncbi:hypothetical protein RND81_04G049200 [Saponaria officinalis]|uniref:Uncharacterized protein n=1 Tax=Saponaria officinalis TaxID=3572 RepID=A0AAW1LF00_SAPOF
MTPGLLIQFIKSNPSEQQITDITSMGFDGLLKLKTDKVLGSLAYWLVSTFDTCSCSLMNGKLRISDEDIHLATGIPMGTNTVDLASSSEKCERFLEAKRVWLTQFRNDTKLRTKQILEKIIKQRGGGVDFKRNFVVFIVSSLLMGVRSATASLRILKSLYEIQSISSFNWCALTRKQWVESVDVWQLPRVFPTLSAWSKEDISKRVNAEKCAGYGKGGGGIEDRLVKSSTSVPGGLALGGLAGGSGGSDPVGLGGFPGDSFSRGPKSVINRLAESAIQLAQSYDKFLQTLVEAKSQTPDSDVVRQMASLAN